MKIADGDAVHFEYNGTTFELEGGFIFNVETKSHSHFELNGEDIVVEYSDGSKKNATKQAWNIKNNLLNYLKKHFSKNVPWVYDVVFFPECSRQTSLKIFGSKGKIPKNFLDSTLTVEMLFKVIVQNDSTRKKYSSAGTNGEIDAIKKFLFGSKSLPRHFANRLELLTINSLKDQQDLLFEDRENYYILRGSPGAGKTILMLGKCMDLIANGHKCLYLTYNKQLVLDLQRLQDAIRSIAPSNPIVSLRIETWESFITKVYSFHNYFRPLGSTPPDFEGKTYLILNRYKNEVGRELMTRDEDKISKNIFKYSAVDYVFVDEAQDLPAGVFNILTAFFSKNICLAVGDQQEYTSTELKETNNNLYLEKIHRQREVPSRIVRAFLEYTKLEHMYQMQKPVPTRLVGGKSIVYVGAINDELYNQVFKYLEHEGAAKIDFLHLHTNHGDAAANTLIQHYCGGNVDKDANIKLDKFRYFHYNSCRGLEGNVVLLEKIDTYYEWSVSKFGELQAKKRLFIALTRVKDVAIFSFADLNHWLYKDVVANFSTIRNSFDI